MAKAETQRAFADCYKGIARYVPDRKSWYCYNDGVWSADTGSLRTMERVQLEIARRRNSEKRTNCGSPFSAKLVCGDCGEFYGSKVWHSNSKYRRTIWQCNGKFKGECKCRTPHLYEDDIKERFISALSELLIDRESLLDNGRLILNELTDCSEIDTELNDISVELDLLELSFDDSLWNWSVEQVTVFADGEMRFRFKNGMEI